MQRITMVRYKIKPERVEENDALSRKVFDELRTKAPAGVAYGCFKEPDGVSYVHLFVNLRDESSDLLTALPSFAAYQAEIGDRCLEPPKATRLAVEMLDGYGFPAD